MSNLRYEEGKQAISGAVYPHSQTPNTLNQKMPYAPEDAPEVVQYQYGSVLPDGQSYEPGLQTTPHEEKIPGTICGLRRRTFWILAGIGILVILIVAIVVPVVVNKQSNNININDTTPPSATIATPTTTTDASTSATPSSNMLDGSGFAAISSGSSLLSFYQKDNGDIFYETQTGEKVVDGPAIVPNLADAKVGTPLASVSWDDGQQVRLYYLNDLNEIQEHSYSGGSWAQGSLSSMGIKALETSQLAAIVFGSAGIRLYFQVSGLVIQEYTWNNGGWSLSQSLPAGISGTGLAALYYPPEDIRVYYQTSEDDLVIHEMTYGWPTAKKWGESPFSTSVKALGVKGSRIAAVSWGNSSDFDMRVLYHPSSNANSINICSWLNSTWEGPKTIVTSGSVDNAAMSAMSPATNQFRLIYQDTTNSSTDLWIVE